MVYLCTNLKNWASLSLGILGNGSSTFSETVLKHFVRLPEGVSNDGPVLSGVPQGTVLGALLFLVLLSNISTDITTLVW